ncbi:MAG TPA: hypothetical protein VFY78_11930 [Gammaproteobacteria bacterium]|jgi:hypothetical protein|nr:hypothetical protein [Gammaproteobacteria bacterium]
MNDHSKSDQLSRQRAQAARTAWILGIIAVLIFLTFIGSAVIGR